MKGIFTQERQSITYVMLFDILLKIQRNGAKNPDFLGFSKKFFGHAPYALWVTPKSFVK